MKFMVHWSVDQENWVPVLQKWTSMTAKEQMDAGKGVKILGRWHEMASRTGVAILEASNAAAVSPNRSRWRATDINRRASRFPQPERCATRRSIDT